MFNQPEQSNQSYLEYMEDHSLKIEERRCREFGYEDDHYSDDFPSWPPGRGSITKKDVCTGGLCDAYEPGRITNQTRPEDLHIWFCDRCCYKMPTNWKNIRFEYLLYRQESRWNSYKGLSPELRSHYLANPV